MAVAPTYGLWLNASQVSVLPTTGAAWLLMANDALNVPWGSPQLYTELNDHGAFAFAGGLYYAKSGDDDVRTKVAQAITDLVASPSTIGATPAGASLTALSVAKQLPGYVLAADLINLASLDATLEGQFRDLITRMLTEPLVNGPVSLTLASQTLPDRWGAWATFAKFLVGVYTASLVNSLQAIQVFQGLLGDRAAYSDLSSPGFDYSLDTSWQPDPALPVPLNPFGAARGSRSIDGALPDELAKSDGPYHFPFPKDQSAWDMLEALTAMTWVLKQRGTATEGNQTSALKRAAEWQLFQAVLSPSAERQWVPWVLKTLYPTLVVSTSNAGRGPAVGYADWTHGPTVAPNFSPPKLTVIYAEGIQPAPEVTPTRWGQFQWGSAVWNGGLALTSGPPALGLVDAVGMDPVSSTLQTITSLAELGQLAITGLDPDPFLPAGSVVSNADRTKILIVGLDPGVFVPPVVEQPAQGSATIRGQWLPGTVVTFFARDLVPEWMREVHDPLEHAKITTRLASSVGAQELFVVTADDNGDVALTDQVEGRYLAAGERDGTVRYVSVNVESGG